MSFSGRGQELVIEWHRGRNELDILVLSVSKFLPLDHLINILWVTEFIFKFTLSHFFTEIINSGSVL